MARYIDAKCRLCRRVGDKLLLKGDRCFTSKCAVERRNSLPGQRAQGRRRVKISDRGIQLREKQKARYTYGIFERQFRKTFGEAERTTGVTGDNLIILLERRLDNVLFRLGFASSRAQARQLVLHGHIDLNGRRTNVPSCLVKAGDEIKWRERSTKSEYYKTLVETIDERIIPGWLSLDTKNMVGKVLALPILEDMEVKFDSKAIVEYYSR
jgi:small subunit ribosomal protein S4